MGVMLVQMQSLVNPARTSHRCHLWQLYWCRKSTYPCRSLISQKQQKFTDLQCSNVIIFHVYIMIKLYDYFWKLWFPSLMISSSPSLLFLKTSPGGMFLSPPLLFWSAIPPTGHEHKSHPAHDVRLYQIIRLFKIIYIQALKWMTKK